MSIRRKALVQLERKPRRHRKVEGERLKRTAAGWRTPAGEDVEAHESDTQPWRAVIGGTTRYFRTLGSAVAQLQAAWKERIATAGRLTHAEWEAAAAARYGADAMAWRFVCPTCGHVASIADWRRLGAPVGAFAYSCVGRWMPNSRDAMTGTGAGPCNYAGGGLFGLNPVRVLMAPLLEGGEPKVQDVFDFADNPLCPRRPRA